MLGWGSSSRRSTASLAARSASRYWCVVAGLSWPSHKAITARSVPDCRRCIAVECRRVCGVTRWPCRDGQCCAAMATARSSRSRTPERVSGAPARLGNTGAVWRGVDLAQPAAQLVGGVLPERDGPLFAALAVQVDCALAVQQHVTDLQVGEFGDAGAGVVGGGEQDRVAPAAPCRAVGRGQDRGDLLAGQVAEHRAVEALGRDGQHACGDRQAGGVAQGGVAHERVDRGQAGVAGAGAVAALGFEVVEEVQHQRRVQVGQASAEGGLPVRCSAKPSSSSNASR